MSKKKLTLSVDERLIRRAKRFSASHDTTVSQLFSEFVDSLEDETAGSAVIERLTGIISGDASREDHCFSLVGRTRTLDLQVSVGANGHECRVGSCG